MKLSGVCAFKTGMFTRCQFTAPLCCALACLAAGASAQSPTPPVPPAATITVLPVEIKILTAGQEFALGQTVRARIEVKNRSKTWLTLRQVTLGDGQMVTDLSGKNVAPGKTATQTLDVTPQMLTDQELGPAQIKVRVETEAGNAESALALSRVDPYKVEIRYDARPVSGGADNAEGDVRSFSVIVTSRKPGTSDVTVSVRVPEGWKLTDGKTPDTRTLRRAGDSRRIGYKVLVPIAAPLGEYPLDATVTVDARTYTARALVAVTR